MTGISNESFYKFSFYSLLGGCLILGIGFTIILSALFGEQFGGAGLIIALGIYVILKQFKSWIFFLNPKLIELMLTPSPYFAKL